MITGEGSAHYLRPAGKTHTPPAVIFVDSETRQHTDAGNEVHTLRCWDACCVWRRDRRRAGETRWDAGADPASLAETISGWASYGETTWLYTHNVAFDLAVTNLAGQLAGLGWELGPRHGLTADGMWCVLRKGRHRLTIADSVSVFPASLADLAPLTGITKPPLPKQGDTAELWAARCHADVLILRALVLGLMDWWDEQDCGPWAVTGAGLGWQTYRRTLAPRQLVIDHDPALLAWERQAVYGGRRDVFHCGQLRPGRWAEVDYTAAHLTVAAECPLPAKAACPVSDSHRRAALAGRVPSGMLAEVTIRTSVPRWPVRAAGRVFYPVGTFRTVLAAPDIQAAADAGALAAVHDGWLYTMTGHLRPWARLCRKWMCPGQAGPAGIAAAAAKLWSRAVVGKFAQRGWRTQDWVGPPCDGWTVEQTTDLYAGTRGVITGLAGRYWLSWADQRGEHERPAVLAFVEAHVRSRLGGVIAGPYGAAVAQCDTDGMLVDLAALRQLAAAQGRTWAHGRRVSYGPDDVIGWWNQASWPLVLRVKTIYKTAQVTGPQHLVLDGKPRMSGVPRGAWATGEGRWAARLWPGMPWQSAHGPPGTYTRPVQGFRVTGPYCAGWVLADGAVRAAEMTVDSAGCNQVLPWAATRWAACGARLGPSQAAWAEGLWEVTDDEPDSASPGNCGPAGGAGSTKRLAAAP